MASLPLALPLEVIERIFKLAFLPVQPPSLEATEPTPPRSTSHLLLVSKGIRHICLPFFWRSITVAKPQDWITLFDPERGLVVVGEEGRQRWEMVDEIKIVVEAVLPITMEPRRELGEKYVHEIIIPSFRQVSRVLFQHLPSSSYPPTWIKKEQDRRSVLARLLMLEDANFKQRMEPVRFWHTPEDGGPPYLAEEWETAEERANRVVEAFMRPFHQNLRISARLVFHDILASLRPLYISTSLRYWEEIDLHDLVGSNSRINALPFTPEVEFNATDHDGYDFDESNVLSTIHDVFEEGVRVRGHFVGFPKDVMEEIEAWLEETKEIRPKTWCSNWTWERADGTTFFVDFSK